MADKKPERNKHYVQIGTIGHVNGGRTSLFRQIMEAEVDENGNIKNKDDANKQICDNKHRGIEINKK